MFNYENLDDVEFEELCKDILEKQLDKKFKIFAKGKDGGVDLTDNVKSHDVIAQVKHYSRSPFSSLKASLKNEIPKIKKLNPKQYYICCSKKLTDQNIKEIYDMFSEYMSSDKNIVTLSEIDDFLQEPTNINIVRKHFKLWLSASNILSEINNQNIFIDCETLLDDIKEDYKFYIQTRSYNTCIKILENYRALILIGAPGVGKTVTSKMLILYFANKGYRIRYTTNGDISDLKKALTVDKDCKEIILLDDCLGQYYFKINDSQENQLISLVKYIKLNNNKMIILNSRVTIFNEAQEHSEEFKKFINNKKVNLHTINMDDISTLEKARIFYNHLVYNKVPRNYYCSIRDNKNYFKIVNHPNYNPRIIEYVTYKSRYEAIKPEKYFEYIMANLNNSHDVWKNEFDHKIQKIDRIFMNILFSLTETSVSYEIFKECFNYRLTFENEIDFTIDNFEAILNRLNKSLVKIIDNKGKREIGVLNPSINDYLQSIFYNNINELIITRKSILYFMQMERCYRKDEFNEIAKQLVIDGKMLPLKTIPADNIKAFTLFIICEFNILSDTYKDIIFDCFKSISVYNSIGSVKFSKAQIVNSLLKEPLLSFYNINDKLSDMNFVDKLLTSIDLIDLVDLINLLYNYYKGYENTMEDFIEICCESLEAEIVKYVEDFDLDSYCEELDIAQIVNRTEKYLHNEGINRNLDEFHDIVVDEAKNDILELVENQLKEEIRENLYWLNSEIKELVRLDKLRDYIDRDAIGLIISSALQPSYDELDEDDLWGNDQFPSEEYLDEIDVIFDRDI